MQFCDSPIVRPSSLADAGAVSAGANSVRNPNIASAWKRGSLGIIDTRNATGEGLQAAAGGAAVSCGGSCLAEARNTSTAGT